MPRKPRIHYEGALYHVIARGNNREYIFKNEIDKEEYLKKVTKYIDKYNGKLYAYVIMDNHCHLLIEVSDIPLSKIMQLIQQTYTSWYNRNYKRSGHVFEQRYKSILCDKDSYLLSLIRYIHQNPVRAKIAGINYKYSSHKEYIRGINNVCLVEEILSMFSLNKKKAIESYIEFMDIEDRELREKGIGDLSPSFENIEIEINKMIFDKKEINKMIFDKKELTEIVESFEDRYKISVKDIKDKYLKGEKLRLRNEFIKEVLKYKAIKQVELSKFLGVSYHLVSKVWNDK